MASRLRVKKHILRFTGKTNGLSYSFNEWRVLRGVKMVRRFERRCDAYAYCRLAIQAESEAGK